MRVRVACCALLFAAATATAQTARVSGRVFEEGRGTPVPNATVRLNGAPDQVTDSLGRFEFTQVSPGRYIFAIAAIGYRFRAVEATIERDTTLLVGMTRRVTTLDTMVVRPGGVRIRGMAVDSASGDPLIQAQAILYPGGKLVGAVSGTFSFDSVAPGPVTIIVEGAEHLPIRVEMDVDRDTSFHVKMGVDSVSLRMIAAQVRRLEQRTHAVPMPSKSLNRDAIAGEGATNLNELILRRAYEDPVAVRASFSNPPDSGCYFVDDTKVPRAVLAGMVPELVERIEIYRSAGGPPPSMVGRKTSNRNFGGVLMVRVYTKRYVAALPRQQNLSKVVYMNTGTRPTCS
jgi:hypothetical protein